MKTQRMRVCVWQQNHFCVLLFSHFLCQNYFIQKRCRLRTSKHDEMHTASVLQQWQSQSNVKVMLKLFQFQQQRQTKEHTI